MLKRLTFAYGLALVTIVILADSGQAAWLFSTFAKVPWGDKLAHFFLMGTMSFLLTLASRADRVDIGGWSLLRAPSWLALVVVIEEFSQIWLSWRGFSFVDLGFDFVGIIIFGYFGQKLRQLGVYESA
ncbi:MAG: VanZ family protein [Anaerolineales bacterium]|jgi:hypothetical protein